MIKILLGLSEIHINQKYANSIVIFISDEAINVLNAILHYRKKRSCVQILYSSRPSGVYILDTSKREFLNKNSRVRCTRIT